MTKDNQRADFEAWHTEAFWNPIFDDEEDCFIPRIVQSRYEAYQAGRAALQSQDREDANPAKITLPMALGRLECTDHGLRFVRMRTVIDCDIEVWGKAQIDEYVDAMVLQARHRITGEKT